MSGVMSTGSERIDAALLDDCPGLKAVCNVGVGCWRRLNLAAPPWLSFQSQSTAPVEQPSPALAIANPCFPSRESAHEEPTALNPLNL